MLVLSRRAQEKVVLPTLGVTVHVVAIKSGGVRLGFEAPLDVPILRHEFHERAAPLPAVSAPSTEHEAVQSASVGVGLALLQLHAGQFGAAALTLEQLQHHFQAMLRPALGMAAGTSPALPPRRALLVEDDPEARQTLAKVLRHAGFEVDEVGDGDDALEYLTTHRRPDVVLLDMGLPRCDGPTTVREIRRNPSFVGLPIFAVTGHEREEFDLAEGPSGVDRWFHKPFDLDVILHDMHLLPVSSLGGI